MVDGATAAPSLVSSPWIRRETRHLPDDIQSDLRGRVQTSIHALAAHINRSRPELTEDRADVLAWAALSVVLSTSFHRIMLPRPAFDDVIASLLQRIVAVPTLTEPLVRRGLPSTGIAQRSRRQSLLNEATRLFAQRSFASVSVDDIGAALGIAGPSIYNHFASKNEILSAALSRGLGYTQMQMLQTLLISSGPADALTRLAHAYATFAYLQHGLVDLLVGEVRNLPDAERNAAADAQREYIAEWANLLSESRPGLDTTAALVEVHAGIMMINDLVRTPHLRSYDGIDDIAARLCTAVLDVPDPAVP